MLNISPDVRKAGELTTDSGVWSVYALQTGEGSRASTYVLGVNV